MEIEEELIAMREEDYRRFTSTLVPNIPDDRILDVRIPKLRKLSRELKNTKEGKLFLHTLPHRYLDENNLHALLISSINEIDETLSETERFLPYIDNWMTSDTMNPGSLRQDLSRTSRHAHKWL